MTMTDSLDGLIERVERCTAPDRGLDVDIAWTLEPTRYGAAYWNGRTGLPGTTLPKKLDGLGALSVQRNCPALTASTDAALALLGRKLPGWSWKLVHEGGRYTFLLRDAPRLEIVAPAWVHSREQPALAIILATLRALQSIKTSETPDK